MPKLSEKEVLALLGPDSPLSTLFKGFQSRPQQQAMMRDILLAYNEKEIALIEAGTGTGKSLAYLIPAALWAKVNGERTVVSTKTIALQEQLLHKDIPLVSKILGCDIKAVIVKGMGNYVCLRKLVDAQRGGVISVAEEEELNKIEAWAESTQDGSRSSLPFLPHPAMWEKVCAETDTCTNTRCEFFESCHFFKARKQAEDAQILISNHHLLFADLSKRHLDENYDETAILPLYSSIILDEAHHIEEVATEFFASKSDCLNLMKTLNRIGFERNGKLTGKLGTLRDQFALHYSKSLPECCRSLERRLHQDVPASRNLLQNHVNQAFMDFEAFIRKVVGSSEGDIQENELSSKDSKLRILPLHKSHESWKSLMEDPAKEMSEALHSFAQSIIALEKDLKHLEDEKLNEKTKTARFELVSLSRRLSDVASATTRFLEDIENVNKVQWMETQRYKTMTNTILVNAELEIAQSLADNLFKPFKTVVLCSATLTTSRNFNFMRNSLGITDKFLQDVKVRESVYESPFDYSKQALFIVPTDMPAPSDPEFNRAAADKIWSAIQASRGNAFVLFTSFQALKQCYNLLHEKLIQNRFLVLRHGDENRQTLLEKFRANDRSVLFGTDTFWEGVDVAGEALRCVILVKLPFKVPSEPIIQARTEAITVRGGNPFAEYSLPNAIVKFKQGFGRLIRNKNDRGCIICLDGRVANKYYGKQFLQSLPDCEKLFLDSESMIKTMGEFYRRTHYLTFQKS